MLTPELAAEFPFGKKILDIGIERGIQTGMERGIQTGLAQGLEQGLERGLAQGLERGIELGRRAAATDLIRAVLHGRFPDLAVSVGPAAFEHLADPAETAQRLALVTDEVEAEQLLKEFVH